MGKDKGEHDQRLMRVLEVLEAKDFRLQKKKLVIGATEIKAFGHVISKDGILPDPDNVKDILSLPTPRSIKEVQSFLGTLNYFLDFLKDVASVAEPLRELGRKEGTWEWGPEQELSFRTLKKMLVKATRLHTFDPKLPTFLTTDASNVGIGALLSQQKEGREVPVAFWSKTLDQTQRRYAANEREALACVLACEHWENFLLGQHFTLRTDHQTLRKLLTSPETKRQSAKFHRWTQRLAEFDYSVEYIPGPHNQVADYLSRLEAVARDLGVESLEEVKKEENMVGGITQEWLREKQRMDKVLEGIQELVRGQEWSTEWVLKQPEGMSFNSVRRQLSVDDGILYQEKRLVVPVEARKEILKQAHVGHPGESRMKALLRQTYWWPKMGKAVEDYIRRCEGCQRSTKTKGAVRGREEMRIPFPKKPGEQYGLDIAGPYFNGQYLVALVDYYSNYPEVLSMKDITSRRIIRWLKEIFSKVGLSSAIVTDNGTQFMSREFTEYLKGEDIHHHTTSLYYPQENGCVEVFNKYLKYHIQAFDAEGQKWDQGIQEAVMAYRMNPRRDGRSPAEVYLGRKVRCGVQPNMTKPVRRLAEKGTSPQAVGGEEPPVFSGYSVFKVGDRVLTKKPWVPKGQSQWRGPRVVKRVKGTYTFLLDDGTVWNSQNLKRYQVEPEPVTGWIGWNDEEEEDEVPIPEGVVDNQEGDIGGEEADVEEPQEVEQVPEQPVWRGNPYNLRTRPLPPIERFSP